jgi:hypothetical protein
MPIQATLLISDDLLFSMQGKMTIVGAYAADINIVSDETPIQQLVCLFTVELDADNAPSVVGFEVTFPGEEPRKLSLPLGGQLGTADRKQVIMRVPLQISNAVLRPGRIGAKVIYDSHELSVGAPWVVNVSARPKPETVS